MGDEPVVSMEIADTPATAASSISSDSTTRLKRRKSKGPKNLSLICDLLSSSVFDKPSANATSNENIKNKKPKSDYMSYTQIINQIKQEKQDFDVNVELYRRSSTSSAKSSSILTTSSSNSNFSEIITSKRRASNRADSNTNLRSKGSLSKSLQKQLIQIH